MGIFLLCSFLMIILYPVGIDLYLVAVPQIAQTLQASEAQIHTAFSIYLFGMAATVLLGGIIADRHGRRWVVQWGALIFVIASLVAANATGISQFYLGRFWQGAGAGADRVSCHSGGSATSGPRSPIPSRAPAQALPATPCRPHPSGPPPRVPGRDGTG